MKTEYLTIKDFAERAGVSQQAIYKQVERKLNNYVKMVENQKMIDIRALQEVYGVEVEQPIQPNFDSILSQNQQMIDMLKEQYPTLADIQCIDTERYSKEDITVLFAKELIKRLK